MEGYEDDRIGPKASATPAFFSRKKIARFCVFFLRVGTQKMISLKNGKMYEANCLFVCFKDREAFQIELLLFVLSFGMLPCLLNKQTNTIN